MGWIRRYDMAVAAERPVGLDLARDAVRRGELVVLPTDTVYGLGTDAFSPAAIAGLLAAKGRGRDMPVPVLVGSWRTLEGLMTRVPPHVRDLVRAFWPGGLTLVVRHAPSLRWDLGDARGTVAVRMPLHPVALELLGRTGPMAVSSANISGRPPATTADDAIAQLGDAVDEQQHLEALLAEQFELRARLGGRQGVGRDVVDALLTLLHARHVVGQGHALVGVRGRKAQQLGQPLRVGVVLADTFLDDRAELLPAIVDAAAILVRSATKVDAEAIAAAKKLRVVARAGVGLDNVDVSAATKAGVMVVNAPTSNIVTAAELACGLIVATARAICARRQIASSTSPGATIIRSASSSTMTTICGRAGSKPPSCSATS